MWLSKVERERDSPPHISTTFLILVLYSLVFTEPYLTLAKMEKPDQNALANAELSSNALAKESIAFRFESQSVIDDARDRRESEWKDAYAR
jgi:hypothetical protein